MSTRKFTLTGLLAALLILCGSIQLLAQTTPDPGVPGPLPVTKAEYDLGDLAYHPPSFPAGSNVEVRGCVHYPPLSGGPYPVIVFLHGRHSTCYSLSTLGASLAWPCPSGSTSIVSYEGYDYLAQNLASHGYIVISISANAINAIDNSLSDYGMQARGELMQHHLDLWNTYNTTGGGPFGTMFVGKLDLTNVGTMGHSRGGEGVVFHALLNRSLGSPYGIKAVLTLAPVDFLRRKLNGIPIMNVAPYCDGDVSNLQGVHFYDDVRYNDSTDEAAKYNVLMMGANHNFFNTVWTPGSYIAGGSDDWLYSYSSTDPWCGPSASTTHRFDTTKQKNALVTYMAAFYRTYVGHDTTFLPILNVSDIVPPVSSTLDSSNVFVSYHAGRTDRVDINRIDTSYNITTNTMGGPVTSAGLVSSGICGGGLGMTACGVSSYSGQEPHKGSSTIKGMAQMNMRWNDTADWYQNELPAAYKDLTTYESILFRASVNFSATTSGTNLDFSVQLIDSLGNIASQVVSGHSFALFYQPGIQLGDLPKVVFNTIKMPLSDFSGIDMARVKYVRFKFNRILAGSITAGSILIGDLAFISQPCGKFNTMFNYSHGGGLLFNFTDASGTNYGDTLSYSWNFGDPASGTADTSSLINPTHLFSDTGMHTVCLYIHSARRNGRLCDDTFCVNVPVYPSLDVRALEQEKITIIPNPAKDYLYITGADKTDVLHLLNLYGQEVYSVKLTETMVTLPQNIASGVYYAIVETRTGNIYKKLIISR